MSKNIEITSHDMFSFHGKMGRVKFFLGLLGAIILSSLSYGAISSVDTMVHKPTLYIIFSILSIGLVILSFWTLFALGSKRFQDIGYNSWLSLLFLVPGLGQILLLILCIIPGKK